MSTPRPQPYSKQAPRATPFPGDEWARIKDKFEELYIKKGWTLKKVMKYMQKHMKFNANARQYKNQMKEVWGFRKYKTSGKGRVDPDAHTHSDGPSSVISSEVDTDDNNVSMGTPEAAVDGGQGNWQLIGTIQEQLPRLGDKFAVDPVGDSTASTSKSRAVEAPPSSAMWPHSELHHSYSMPMPQGPSDDQWPCQTHGGEMVPTHKAPALVTSSFANSYHELQSMGAVSNLDDDPLILPGPVSRGWQQNQSNQDSFETIGSTPLSYCDIVNAGNLPRSL